MRMYNPPHPGEVIREYLGEMTVSAAAEHLGVGRVTFSRVLNGKAAVSPEMAVRLAAAFGLSLIHISQRRDTGHPARATIQAL